MSGDDEIMKAVVSFSGFKLYTIHYSRIFMWRGTARNKGGPAPQCPRGDTPDLNPYS